MPALQDTRDVPTGHDEIPKVATGIWGLDEITGGGLPRGRPTLICGGPGCGKTVMAMEFLVRGARAGEPGVFMSFEESAEELALNVRSFGFDIPGLIADERLLVDHVRVERSEIQETGDYDLDGLFIRLGHAIGKIGATRVVLDTIESLFSGLENTAVLRAELRRLFHWLKDRGVTTIITGERGDGQLTRQGLEEYVSDCVIMLDHRVNEQISTRRIRVVKYRGALHGTNEYPFMIGPEGLSILPVSSLGLAHEAPTERVSSGGDDLDVLLGGGFFRGSSVLVSGPEGTGKTSIATRFVAEACRRGEPSLLFSFEESEAQLQRNMLSIGVDLEPAIRKGLLQVHAARPTMQGLEAHLVAIHRLLAEFAPKNVVLDPINGLVNAGLEADVQAVLLRLVDHMKGEGITSIFTSLTMDNRPFHPTELAVSSFIDTLIQLRNMEHDNERHLGLVVLKSRGTDHSRAISEYHFSKKGIVLGKRPRKASKAARTARR
jgi:circadian clock protein KaiC